MWSIGVRAGAIRRRLVLPEPQDPRILAAASHAKSFADIVLVGNPENVVELSKKTSLDLKGVSVVDPSGGKVHQSGLLERLSKRLYARRGGKDIASFEEAMKKIKSSPLYFGNLLVAENFAHGQVAGSLTTTSDVVKAALHCVGTAPGIKTASSFMLMIPPHNTSASPVVFTDCGFVVDPTAEQLAELALSASLNARSLGIPSDGVARVAMLSFSTLGSAEHISVDKVHKATELLKRKLEDSNLIGQILVEGELQFDAAFDKAVAERKAPESTVAGMANVFVFPDLNAGNIGYKIAERMGGWKAVGPIMQGFNKPTNDLSRGCKPSDIVDALAITALQVNETSSLYSLDDVAYRL